MLRFGIDFSVMAIALAHTGRNVLRELASMPASEFELRQAHKPDASELRAVMAETDRDVQQKKMSELMEKQNSLAEGWKKTRREDALRLAYLRADEAVRAKVQFIAAEGDSGEPTSIAPMMIDGLPSSRNKELQLALLQAAWVDPDNLPSSMLQTALREAKQLMHGQTVTDESRMWVGTPEQRETQLKEYQAEIDEIVATLPLRSPENCVKTIDFMKKLAVPNQFNHRTGNR
jgi:hypothetical protein